MRVGVFMSVCVSMYLCVTKSVSVHKYLVYENSKSTFKT